MEEVLLTEEDTGGCEGSSSVVSPKGGKGAQCEGGEDQWELYVASTCAHSTRAYLATLVYVLLELYCT